MLLMAKLMEENHILWNIGSDTRRFLRSISHPCQSPISVIIMQRKELSAHILRQSALTSWTMRSLQYQRLKLVILGALLFGISNAQNLVFTSGYSSSEQSFLLDLQAGTLSEAGQQDVEPNLTFMDISPDGRDIYLVHEVTQYDGFGDNGAVSLWRKGRDIMGKPIFGKIQVRQPI